MQNNTVFKKNDKKKNYICDKIVHKDIRIPVNIHQMNKNFSDTVQPKNACKLEFSDHLLPN